jgi:CRP-like cAMP-binding protein
MLTREAFDRIPFLKSLDADGRRRLLQHAEVRVLGRGQHVWLDGQSGDEVAFALRGRMKLVKRGEDARETILDLAAPGDLLCTSAIHSTAPYCCSSTAMEDETEVLVLPRREVLDTIEHSAAAARAFVREMGCRTEGLCRRVEELASGHVEQRIATLLLKLTDRVGVKNGIGIKVPVPLSRQDIADLCGTTVETAIRVMSRLKKQEVVQSMVRGFLVRDRARLEDIARGRVVQLAKRG